MHYIGHTQCFFLSKNSLFLTGCGAPQEPLREKNFFLGQIPKTVMSFGHPFTTMESQWPVELSHIHKSTDIRVLLDDEHLAVHFACQLIPKGSMSLHGFDCV